MFKKKVPIFLFTPVIETVDKARTWRQVTGTGSETNGGRYIDRYQQTPPVGSHQWNFHLSSNIVAILNQLLSVSSFVHVLFSYMGIFDHT